MNTKQDYQEMIIKFNSDKDIIALREKYKEPTFFEIISKQRSETTYSSFLKWMFQSSSTDFGTVSPLLLLLDVLVAKSKVSQIPDEIKTHIITRNFKINSIEVETEKSVSSVAAALGINNGNSFKGWTERDIQRIIAKCQDKIDIFINCEIELNDRDTQSRKLQIIIENKIDSGEGKGKSKEKTGVDDYDDASQTQRYYYATALKNCKEVVQLYVYLAPAGADECEQDTYIQINYQDIVDGIILPMLASSTLSIRQRFFLEELKTELTFPSLESTRVRTSIANSGESLEYFMKIWNNYKTLILSAAVCSIESDIWICGGEYIVHRPTNKALLDKCILVDKQRTLNKWSKKIGQENIRIGKNERSDFDEFLQDLRLYPSLASSTIEDSYLLKSFWSNNQRFLLAVMSGVLAVKEKEHENEKVVLETLLIDSSKRDTTKYHVYYNGKCLNDECLKGKDIDKEKDNRTNNGETAWLIVKAWLEKNNEDNNPVDIECLNKTFTPRACNSYYSNGKWLKKLFYQYKDDGKYIADGTESEGHVLDVTNGDGGWDFYRPKDDNDSRFQLSLSNGVKVIMLKMWRKDDLRKLYNYVKKDGIDIDVQPEL